MRWTRRRCADEALLTRTAKSCGPDASTLALSWRSYPLTTVTNKPDHRGEHEGTRKTIARGMPGDSGVTVVTTLGVAFFLPAGCGRIERPAFPAPSASEGRTFSSKTSRKNMRRECETVSTSLRGAKATKQSTLSLLRDGLLRFARNDDLGCLKIESKLSSPAKAGDPVFHRRRCWNRKAAAYWMPRLRGA
jgi:hypothetical protein